MIPQNAMNGPGRRRLDHELIFRAFVRTFFRLLYHELAWTYDVVAWLVSFGQWKAWGRAAIPRLRGRRILELAHGPGHLLVAIERAGFAPVGLDLSPQMGQLARRRLRDGSCDVPLVRARAQALPFRAGAFDSVVSTFPTEFIVDPATLQEVARVIGQAGRAVVVPGIVFGASLPARALELLYTVTGQHKPELPRIAGALADALAGEGLALEQGCEPMGLAEVQILVAGKPGSADAASRRLRQG